MKSALRLLSVSLLLVIAACNQNEDTLRKPLDLGAPSSIKTAPAAITNGVPVGNLSGSRSSQRFDSITVPSGATNLQISISGGSGDADLYVRYGSRPTTSTFDCRPYRTGNNETCTFSAPRSGTYQIMLRGYTAYSGVTLRASYSSGTTNPPPTTGNFNIQFVFGPNVSSSQKTLFNQAGARWSQVITGDVANVPVNKRSNLCGVGEPALNSTVDDVVIYAEVGPIDGSGGTLAQAGPCLVRGGGVTSYGVMSFDSADVDSVNLTAVILHEMGHVLGIGTLWERFGLVNYTSGCPSAPRYSGSSARSEWNAFGGSGNIPVENNGGQGTACGHWDEETFDSELMTGFIEQSGAIPLSRMTAGTLEDMDYTVNKNATDPYSLPSCSPSCNSLAPQALDIASREVLLEPVGVSLPNGVIEIIEQLDLDFDQ